MLIKKCSILERLFLSTVLRFELPSSSILFCGCWCHDANKRSTFDWASSGRLEMPFKIFNTFKYTLPVFIHRSCFEVYVRPLSYWMIFEVVCSSILRVILHLARFHVEEILSLQKSDVIRAYLIKYNGNDIIFIFLPYVILSFFFFFSRLSLLFSLYKLLGLLLLLVPTLTPQFFSFLFFLLFWSDVGSDLKTGLPSRLPHL